MVPQRQKKDWANFDFIVREIGGKLYHTQGRERVRMRVRIRDSFQCQVCKKTRTLKDINKNPKLRLFDVHHLDGECGKNSRGYDSIDIIPKLITLCHKCHYNHHEFSKKQEEGRQKKMIVYTKKYIRIKKLLDKGLSYSQIGNEYGVTRQRIQQIIAKGI